MPNYTTEAKVQQRFDSQRSLAHLTDDEDTGVPSSTVVLEAINEAEALIDSYLARRYAVPVSVASDSNISRLLDSRACDLTVYFLFSRPGINVTNPLQTFYEQTVGWLREIAAGEADLPGASAPASTTSRDPVADYGTGELSSSSDRVFTRESMRAM